MTRTEILDRISNQKHGRSFSELFALQSRLEIMQEALDECLCKLASDGDLADVTNSCSQWIPDKKTSATSCANCGKDRWAHDL
jgi:hypothetical protein